MAIHLFLALRIVVIPAGIAALALVCARSLTRRPDTATRMAALGGGAGVLAALIGLAGLPPVPPVDSIGWVPIATGLAIVAVPFLGRGPGILGVLVVIAAAAAYLIGKPAWSTAGAGVTALGIAGTAVAVVAVSAGLAWSAVRLHPTAVYLGFTVAAIGAALSCVLSHSALLAMICGGIAATAGTLAVGGAILRVPLRGAAVAGLLALPAAGVLLYARLFSALPALTVVLLVAAGLAPALAAALPHFRGRSIAAIVLAAVFAAGAATVAMRAGTAAEDAAGGHDDADDLYKH